MKKKILMPLMSLLVLALLILMLWGQWDPFSWIGNLYSSSSSVMTVESELKKLALLNTAEYQMRIIFPYDFVDSPSDWAMYKNYYDYYPGEFAINSDPAEYVNGELPEKWQGAPFYGMCRQAGIDPFNFRYDVLIFSVIVKAGTDLNSISGIGLEDSIIQASDDKDSQWILQLPDAVITDLIIEDLDYREWGYPDPAITPEEYRALVEFLRPRMEEVAIKKGILDVAEKRRNHLLRQLLEQTVPDNIVIP